MFSSTAFISPLSQSLFTKSRLSSTKKCDRSVAHVARTPVMQDRKTSTPSSNKGAKKKKESPLTFANDIKGNVVWVLRSATTDDIPELVSVLDSALPASMVGNFVEENTCCTVCEVSVKGAKEGSSYTGMIMGGVLVDVTVEVKDPSQGFSGGLVKRGELVTLAVDPRVPDTDDVTEKLVLGSLAKMKKEGVIEVVSLVSEENEKRVALLSKCLFKVKATSRGRVTMVCRLSNENPNPKKRMS